MIKIRDYKKKQVYYASSDWSIPVFESECRNGGLRPSRKALLTEELSCGIAYLWKLLVPHQLHNLNIL